MPRLLIHKVSDQDPPLWRVSCFIEAMAALFGGTPGKMRLDTHHAYLACHSGIARYNCDGGKVDVEIESCDDDAMSVAQEVTERTLFKGVTAFK